MKQSGSSGTRKYAVVLATSLLGFGACGCDERYESRATPSTVQPAAKSRGRQVMYVPAYTFVAARSRLRASLATTLTIHNVHLTQSLKVHSVEYHDSPGKVLRNYLSEPRTLKPLETLEFLVSDVNPERGAGASFLVSYDATDTNAPPLVEAVMVGNTGSGWLAFASRGVVVANPPPPAAGAPIPQ